MLITVKCVWFHEKFKYQLSTVFSWNSFISRNLWQWNRKSYTYIYCKCKTARFKKNPKYHLECGIEIDFIWDNLNFQFDLLVKLLKKNRFCHLNISKTVHERKLLFYVIWGCFCIPSPFLNKSTHPRMKVTPEGRKCNKHAFQP